MDFCKSMFPVILFLFLGGCMNEYEKDAVGAYGLYQYEVTDQSKEIDEFAVLKLKENKTFELKYDNKVTIGDWSADDNGDQTTIELTYKNKKAEGQIGRDRIELNSLDFIDVANFKSVSFIKK
jgi:hypothetical protein